MGKIFINKKYKKINTAEEVLIHEFGFSEEDMKILWKSLARDNIIGLDDIYRFAKSYALEAIKADRLNMIDFLKRQGYTITGIPNVIHYAPQIELL